MKKNAKTPFWQYLYAAYALLLFFLLMLPVFFWSMLVLPLGRLRSGNLIYRACTLWGDVWFFLIFIKQQNIYEEKPAAGTAYIFVANHSSYFDAPALIKAVRQPVRPLGKADMTRIPIFGFIYRNAIVTVDRSSARNRVKSVQRLKAILRRGISILVFPEGTFNETGQPLAPFYDGAFRIAIETGTPIMPLLFLDAAVRMPTHKALHLTPGRNRTLFLKPIPTAHLTAADAAGLKELVFARMWQAAVDWNAPWIEQNL